MGIGVVCLLCGTQALGQQTTESQPRMMMRAPLLPPTNDPFAAYVAPQPVSTQSAMRRRSASVVPVPPAPVATPEWPPLDLIYVGRFVLNGQTQVLAQYQGQTVWLTEGATLPNGYVVQTITPNEVALLFESVKHVERWTLPLTPTFETR